MFAITTQQVNGGDAVNGLVSRSTLTGLWVASMLDEAGSIVEEQDFGCEYDAWAWLARGTRHAFLPFLSAVTTK